MLKLSPEGRKFIQHFETCQLEAYPDGQYFSIGWGHNGPDVTAGMKISKTKAGQLFVEDIGPREEAVNAYVKVPLLQHEFDALVSLTYNIGIEAFRTSTLLSRLNHGDRIPAADHFLRWNKFQGGVNGGLVRRRAAEKKLFTGFDHSTAIKMGDEAYEDYKQGL